MDAIAIAYSGLNPLAGARVRIGEQRGVVEVSRTEESVQITVCELVPYVVNLHRFGEPDQTRYRKSTGMLCGWLVGDGWMRKSDSAARERFASTGIAVCHVVSEVKALLEV